jgi:nitroreductase
LEVWDAIKGRRSIRKYKTRLIEDELIKKILEAGRWAPSGSNMQMWGTRKFIVVKDRKTLDMIRKVSPGYLGATPLAIFVCSDRRIAYEKCGKLGRDYITIADCAMAVENMQLMAYSLGLGACTVKSFSTPAVKHILEIPEDVEPELMVVIGHPDVKPSPPPKIALEEITYLDKYDNEFFKEG